MEDLNKFILNHKLCYCRTGEEPAAINELFRHIEESKIIFDREWSSTSPDRVSPWFRDLSQQDQIWDGKLLLWVGDVSSKDTKESLHQKCQQKIDQLKDITKRPIFKETQVKAMQRIEKLVKEDYHDLFPKDNYYVEKKLRAEWDDYIRNFTPETSPPVNGFLVSRQLWRSSKLARGRPINFEDCIFCCSGYLKLSKEKKGSKESLPSFTDTENELSFFRLLS